MGRFLLMPFTTYNKRHPTLPPLNLLHLLFPEEQTAGMHIAISNSWAFLLAVAAPHELYATIEAHVMPHTFFSTHTFRMSTA